MKAVTKAAGDQVHAPVQLALFALPEEASEIASGTPAPVPPEGRRASSTKTASSEGTAMSTAPDLEAVATDPAPDSPRVSARPQATTLKGAIAEYQQYLVSLNSAKHTRDSFGLDLKLLLEHLGDVPLTMVGERELRSYISWVRVERKNNPISVRRKVASLKGFFSYLHRERAIAHDPALRLIYPEIYPALPEFLEEHQVTALMEAAAEHLSWQALLALMLETGLKRDEVVALGGSDVFLGTDDGQEGYLVVRETEQAKRLRSRRLEIGVDTTALLRRFLIAEPPRERFFDLSPRGVNFIVETCGKRARIRTKAARLTPQILRETFAVRRMRRFVAAEEALRASGSPEEAVSALCEQHEIQLLRLLGLHEEPETAKKYRKLVHGWSSHVQC